MAPRKRNDDLSDWGGEEKEHFTHNTLVLVGGNVVLLLWAASAVVGALTNNYTMMQLVTPVMLIYAGYLFGKPLFDRAVRNGNGS